jgi:aminoglycoside phosphotransferase (APT) family kinase protein
MTGLEASARGNARGQKSATQRSRTVRMATCCLAEAADSLPSAPMPPHQTRSARQALVQRLAESRRRRLRSELVHGHHNMNYIVPLGVVLALLLRAKPFSRAKYRVPIDTVEVVPRIWSRESDVLRVVTRHLREVPRWLADFGEESLHVYRRGKALSETNPSGAVDERLMRSFAAFFAKTASVPASELPPTPADWPQDGDSQGFLHWLVDFTEIHVRLAHRARFGSLLDDLLVPENAMTRFKEAHTGLTSRPFCLLHTDVHRANTVLHRNRLAVIDWELAIYGDPLHELATHMVRMAYGKQEQARMVELWTEAMEEAGHGELTAGVDDDLPVYVAFEYAQSVFPDVMRAALALPDQAYDGDYEVAARKICTAMTRAREPLQLVEVPDLVRAMDALRKWHTGKVVTSGRTEREPESD